MYILFITCVKKVILYGHLTQSRYLCALLAKKQLK